MYLWVFMSSGLISLIEIRIKTEIQQVTKTSLVKVKDSESKKYTLYNKSFEGNQDEIVKKHG